MKEEYQEMTPEEKEQFIADMKSLSIDDFMRLRRYMLELVEIRRLKRIEEAVNQTVKPNLTVLSGRMAN